MKTNGEISLDVEWPSEWETKPLPGGEDGERTMQVVLPRSWRQRLFSWPWRPWHNVEVTELRVTLRESNVDTEMGEVDATFVVVGEPTYVRRTARQKLSDPSKREMA